jgi:hypothetical protein
MTLGERILVHSPTHCPQCNLPLTDPPPNFCPQCGYSLLAAVPSTTGSSKGAFGPAPGYRPSGLAAVPNDQTDSVQQDASAASEPRLRPVTADYRQGKASPRRRGVPPHGKGRRRRLVVRLITVVLAVMVVAVTACAFTRRNALPDLALAIKGAPLQAVAPPAPGRPLVVQIARGLKELSQHCGGISLLRASDMVQSGLQELHKGGDASETDLSLLNAYNLALRADGGKWGAGCTRVTSTLISLTLHPNG